MRVYYEKNGAFAVSDAVISYTVIFNSGGSEYAQGTHDHSSYELQYAITDGWSVSLGDETSKMSEGQIYFIPPFCFHSFRPVHSTEECKKISLKFSVGGSRSKKNSAISRINAALCFSKKPCFISDERLSYLFGLMSLCYPEDYKNEALVSNLVAAVIICFIGLCEKRTTEDSEKKTRTVNDLEHLYAIHIEDFIATNYKSSATTLHALAESMHLSDRQAERLCKRIFGASFTALLTRQRMTVAKALIAEKRDSLSVIAEKVGFNSYTGFYKSYKKYYNTNPNG